jgi:hypothetical protein
MQKLQRGSIETVEPPERGLAELIRECMSALGRVAGLGEVAVLDERMN